MDRALVIASPMLLLLLFVVSALGASFLCSLLEAALLSSRVVELSRRRDDGDVYAGRLLRIKQERIDDAISSILILNTVANTLGATLAGAQAEQLFDKPWVAVFTGTLVVAVLFLSEILPKTLGTVYASKLIPFVAVATEMLTRVLRPALTITRILTRLIGPSEKQRISLSDLATMVSIAAREGTLGAVDSRVVTNVLRYHEIRVEDVMTPRTVVTMLPLGTTVSGLLADERSRVYSRIPLYDKSPDAAIGYVLQREVLGAVARGRSLDTPLDAFLRKAPYIPETLAVGRAMQRLLESREHLALVTDEYGGLAGLVTLEDLMETLLGVEILDESDRIADLRAEASRLRAKRLEALAKRLEESGTDSPG